VASPAGSAGTDGELAPHDAQVGERREVAVDGRVLDVGAVGDLLDLLLAGGEGFEDREVNAGLSELLLEDRATLVPQRAVRVEHARADRVFELAMRELAEVAWHSAGDREALDALDRVELVEE